MPTYFMNVILLTDDTLSAYGNEQRFWSEYPAESVKRTNGERCEFQSLIHAADVSRYHIEAPFIGYMRAACLIWAIVGGYGLENVQKIFAFT
jgi:hypothetical protein